MSSEKYKGKYNVNSSRLQKWDYGWNAAYFITICTKDREHFFGEINAGVILSSEIGEIVKTEWLRTPELRPDMNLTLDEFVIMPDHFHGIINIGKNIYNTRHRGALQCASKLQCASPTLQCASSLDGGITLKNKNHFGPQRKNLGSIIRGFKSAVTIRARLIDKNFRWQPRFYEHIIRSNEELNRIRAYISQNPKNWQ